jgi:hydroxymethylglutaryl-CoA reductase
LLGEDAGALEAVLERGGLERSEMDLLAENVLGLFALPFSAAPNFIINGRETIVPMVVEEPSVVAAASNAARIVREGGGFFVRSSDPAMICQVQIFADEPGKAAGIVLANRQALLDAAGRADPVLAGQGGGPVGLETRIFAASPDGPGFLVVHLLVDVRDAMGANAVNTMGEAIATAIESMTGGTAGLCILSNLADRRLVVCEAAIPAAALASGGFSPEEVRDGIAAASRFAELDPYRAATHNKGIMNGVDAVVVSTGNDWRAVEAGAHAYAARGGRYGPLCTWSIGKNGSLEGRLEMPLPVGIVGGMTRAHPAAKLAVRLAGACCRGGRHGLQPCGPQGVVNGGHPEGAHAPPQPQVGVEPAAGKDTTQGKRLAARM